MTAVAVPVAHGFAATCDQVAGPDRAGKAAAASASCGTPVDGRFEFDIEPQALDRAIEAFGATVGQSVIYDSKLTAGKVSRGALGRLGAAEAIARILEGSGLTTRRVGEGALVLVRDESAAPMAPARDADWYYGAIQERLGEAFCRQPELAAGQYRLALQLWFAADGRVERAKLLESTGRPQVDAAAYAAAHEVELGAAVPAQLAQPFTLLVLPRGTGYQWACPSPEAKP